MEKKKNRRRNEKKEENIKRHEELKIKWKKI